MRWKCPKPTVQEKYELTDARKAALFALIDLAVAWHGAPEVLYFVENSKGIDASQLRHVVVQLSRKTLPPYSFRFAHAVATLLSCFKAKQIWHSETYSHEDRQLIERYPVKLQLLSGGAQSITLTLLSWGVVRECGI